MDRSAIVHVARWCVTNQSGITYAQVRPIQGLGHPFHTPLAIDCSGFVTVCYNWAKAPDPNGLHYDGRGYTGTILQAGEPIRPEAALISDLIVFGRGTGNHVVLIVETGANPLVASHGSDAGPRLIDYRSEFEWQKQHHGGDATVRFIRVRDAANVVEPLATEAVDSLDLSTASNPASH